MLKFEVEDVETLTSLGLTQRQAKVYLALVRSGLCKAEAISRASLIHRQEVYRVVDSLKKLGLVQIEVNTPMMVSAVPIREALAILFQRKTRELDKIQGKAKSLIDKINRSDLPDNLLMDEPHFRIVSENDRVVRFRSVLENARQSVEIMTSWKRFRQGFSVLDDSLQKALAHGATLRVITEKPENAALPAWVTQALNGPNFRLEAISVAPPAVVSIYDAAEVCIAINAEADLTSGPHLWSNNRNLVVMCQDYFEFMWARLEERRSN